MDFVLSSVPLPLRLTPSAPVSDEDLLRLSAANDALRIEREANGDLLIMSPTGGKTGMINLTVSRALAEWTESDGRGYAFDSSAGFRLPDGSVRSPDAAWLLKERWDSLTERQQEGYTPLCPEFVIELTSPSDRLPDVQKKIVEEWLPNGVELAWLIDQKSRAVHVFRAGDEPEVLFDPSTVQGTGPVRGFELVLERLWSV